MHAGMVVFKENVRSVRSLFRVLKSAANVETILNQLVLARSNGINQRMNANAFNAINAFFILIRRPVAIVRTIEHEVILV